MSNPEWVQFGTYNSQIVYRCRTTDQPDGSQYVEYQLRKEEEISIDFSLVSGLMEKFSEFSKKYEDAYIYSYVKNYDQVGHEIIGWLPLTGTDREKAVSFKMLSVGGL